VAKKSRRSSRLPLPCFFLPQSSQAHFIAAQTGKHQQNTKRRVLRSQEKTKALFLHLAHASGFCRGKSRVPLRLAVSLFPVRIGAALSRPFFRAGLLLRTVDLDWPDSLPQALRSYRAIRAHHLATSLALKRVFGTDLPPTIGAMQSSRPVTFEKFALHHPGENYRK
jgi:hypothetical protein